jgi:pimeloyl-ACP methyl ester carboxylesterase
MASLDRDGVRIHYEVRGEGEAVPLLLTHGFASSSHAWAPAVDELSRTRRCITWDVRGHGQTDYPDGAAAYSVPLTIGDMAAILDALAIDRAVLIGHSMGGYLSLEFVKAHPERVAGLVLVGTGPGFRNDDARDNWNQICERYATRFEARGNDGFPKSEEISPEAHRGVDGLIRAARGILRQRDSGVLDSLPNIDVPTLIVVGEKDEPFLAGSGYMAKKIPNARHVLIEGAPHAPMLTHTEQFTTEVEALLAQL